MVDNSKLIIDNPDIIKKLINHPDFIVCKPKNNNYHSLKHRFFGIKLSLDFRKSFENGLLVGYRHLEINISPHYHFNQYRHNGNDFTPENCIKTITDILSYLGIEQNEFKDIKVCNIEFGLNLVPEIDIKNLIDGILFYKKTPFKVGDYPYFKKTNATKYKQIKAYAKGLQFADVPEYGIHTNTFRFEVKSKESKYIKKLGITTIDSILEIDVYSAFKQELIKEWDFVLSTAQKLIYSNLTTEVSNYIRTAKKISFWNDLIDNKQRNTFSDNKRRYYKMLKGNNNVHSQIKVQIIDKLVSFSKCANSTQVTPINKEFSNIDQIPSILINLESAQLLYCKVTGLNISGQKENSKFLREKALKEIKTNQPDIYLMLEKKYLKDQYKNASEKRQLYLICKNIRDVDSNKRNNRKSFEKRNYNQNQLQFQF